MFTTEIHKSGTEASFKTAKAAGERAKDEAELLASQGRECKVEVRWGASDTGETGYLVTLVHQDDCNCRGGAR